MSLGQNPPRLLTIVRAGKFSIHRSWIFTVYGLTDVAISLYDDLECNEADSQYVHHYVGGKLQGVANFFEKYPDALEKYDFFWLMEDDIYIPHSSLVTILNLLDIFRFKLSAPSVSYYSHFAWPITVSNNRFVFRGTNFVDVMAPIFSREMLIEALPAFGENYSSWGHEHLWHKLLNERREFGVIIDSAPIANTRPAGQGTLPLYRPSDSDPRKEVEAMFQKYNLDRTVKFRNLFGVTKYDGIVWGNTFTQCALSGYEEMSTLETDHLYRCVDFLSRGPRPIMSLQELRVMQGFARIEERYRIRPDLTLGGPGKSYQVSEIKAGPLYAAEINSQRAETEPPSIIEPI